MADRTDISGTAISTAYLQVLFTSDTAGITVTGASPADSLVCSSSSGTSKKSCLRIGVDQCSIASGSHNFDVASHNGTYGLKLGGTLVTSTAAELNYLDTTSGASAASKAMICDSSGDIYMPDSDKFELGASSDMQLYHDGSNSYIANKVGALKIATETSGIVVTIGHTTSETTIADNATVTGNLSVGGNFDVTGTLDFSDSAITNIGDIALDTITNDGTDITLDSSNDIVIDAAGGNVEFKDAGVLQLTLDMDTTSGVQILKLGVDTDDLVFQQYDGNEVCRMADDRRLYFYDKGGEYIYGDGTDLHITSGADINIPANIGLTFGDDGEKIEGNGTNLTLAGGDINLTAEADVNIPVNIGLRFGDGNQHIETDNTDFTITSDVAINLNSPVLDIVNQGTTIELKQQVDALAFDGAADNILNIDATNNRVGIGTAAPTTTLEVTGGLLQQNVTLQSGTAAEDLTGTTGNLIWYATTTQAGDITLPQATSANAGMVIKIIAGANWSATAFKLGYTSGGSTVMVGTLRVSALDAVLTTSFAITASSKNLVIDADAVATAGGAKGSTYTFTYLAANLVHVDANAYITTGTVATTAAASVTGGI